MYVWLFAYLHHELSLGWGEAFLKGITKSSHCLAVGKPYGLIVLNNNFGQCPVCCFLIKAPYLLFFWWWWLSCATTLRLLKKTVQWLLTPRHNRECLPHWLGGEHTLMVLKPLHGSLILFLDPSPPTSVQVLLEVGWAKILDLLPQPFFASIALPNFVGFNVSLFSLIVIHKCVKCIHRLGNLALSC